MQCFISSMPLHMEAAMCAILTSAKSYGIKHPTAANFKHQTDSGSTTLTCYIAVVDAEGDADGFI